MSREEPHKIGMRVCPLGGSGSFDAGTWGDRVVTSVLSVEDAIIRIKWIPLLIKAPRSPRSAVSRSEGGTMMHRGKVRSCE